MPLSVNTNTAASSASYFLSKNNAALQKSLNRLSSGKRITKPADDAGGLAVSMKLQGTINRLSGVENNIGNAISYLQVQDGLLESAAKIVDRMGELKALSQDVLKNSSDIENFNSEFRTLQVQLYQMSATTFNGVSLFATKTTSTGSIDAVFGNDNSGTDNTISIFTTEGGVSGPKVSIHKAVILSAITFQEGRVSINKAFGASGTITFAATTSANARILADFETSFFTQAIENVASLRAQNGGAMSRLEFATSNLDRTRANLEASYGQIMDVDIAEESTRLAKYQILVQASASMLAQANMMPNSAMMLLG